MADMDEQDRRHFALAVKTQDPLKTYADIKTAVEESMTPQPEVDDEPVQIADWLRKT